MIIAHMSIVIPDFRPFIYCWYIIIEKNLVFDHLLYEYFVHTMMILFRVLL